MAEISDFFKEMAKQLQHPDVQEINYLLKDTLPSKWHNSFISNILKILIDLEVICLIFFLERYVNLK